MGSWEVIIAVRVTDEEAVTQAIGSLFSLDGYRQVPKPSDRICRERLERRIYENFTQEPYWGVAARPGNAGWLSIACDPAYLLCDRARESKLPRLAALARSLECEAFELNLYDGADGVLVECLPNGRYQVTGSTHNLADEMFERFGSSIPNDLSKHTFPYYQEILRGDRLEPRFMLLRDLAQANDAFGGDYESAVPAILDLIGCSFEMPTPFQSGFPSSPERESGSELYYSHE